MDGGSYQVMSARLNGQNIIEDPLVENLESPRVDINTKDQLTRDFTLISNYPSQVTRLFVIQNNGEGFELLNQSQIDSFSLSLSISTEKHIFSEGSLSFYTFLTPVSLSLIKKGYLASSPLLQAINSQISAYIKPESEPPKAGHLEYYVYRGFIRHPQFTYERRDEFLICMKNYQN